MRRRASERNRSEPLEQGPKPIEPGAEPPATAPGGWRLIVNGRDADVTVDVAITFAARLRGWLGRRSPPPGRALWLEPCDAIHTCGMRFPVDIVFVDRLDQVCSVLKRVRPWRARLSLGACAALEVAEGEADRLGLAPGAHLRLAARESLAHPGPASHRRVLEESAS